MNTLGNLKAYSKNIWIYLLEISEPNNFLISHLFNQHKYKYVHTIIIYHSLVIRIIWLFICSIVYPIHPLYVGHIGEPNVWLWYIDWLSKFPYILYLNLDVKLVDICFNSLCLLQNSSLFSCFCSGSKDFWCWYTMVERE